MAIKKPVLNNPVSLKAKIEDISTTVLEFSNLRKMKDADGNDVAILTLKEPLMEAVGSQKIDMGDGKSDYIREYDVEEVKVRQEDFDDNEDFEFEADGTEGFYYGKDLFIDVAKSTRETWLVSTSFAQAGNDWKRKNREDRVSEIAKRQLERNKTVGKSSGKLEPVSTGG